MADLAIPLQPQLQPQPQLNLNNPPGEELPPPDQPFAGGDNDLWLVRNRNRLMKKYGTTTRVRTIKFQSAKTDRCHRPTVRPSKLDLCQLAAAANASHRGSHDESRPSPSTLMRADEIEFERRYQRRRGRRQQRHGMVNSLDDEEEEMKEEEHDDNDDEVDGSDEDNDSQDYRRRRIGQNNTSAPNTASSSSTDATSGNFPSIIIDPSSSLFTSQFRPRIVGVSDSPSSSSSALSPPPLIPAPAIWATDHVRHTLRCVFADGQIHTVAGGGTKLKSRYEHDLALSPLMVPSSLHVSPPDSSSSSHSSSSSSSSGYSDGTATLSALFSKPRGLVLHPLTGELFVADSGNHCIRVVTSPTVMRTALEDARRRIEDENSFRTLSDPTMDPDEEATRQKRIHERMKKRTNSSSSYSSSSLASGRQLSSSLNLVLSLLAPVILDYVGFDVRTIAGTPTESGCRDSQLDANGRVSHSAQFKYPVGMAIRMVGRIETKETGEDDGDAAAAASMFDGSNLTPSAYELYVSDAGNGCIRRIRPNPFIELQSKSQCPRSNVCDEFIVDTIHAYVPRRCCHSSWLSSSSRSTSSEERDSGAKVEESKEANSPSRSSSPTPTQAATSSFTSTLLSNLGSSPSRLLGSDACDDIRFQYPIGIAIKLDKRVGHGQELKEVPTKYGSVWIVETRSSNSGALVSRTFAPYCSLIVVDARASSISSLDLSPSAFGCLKRLGGSSDSQWGYLDGSASRARFCRPSGVAVDQRTSDILIADAGNSCIRLIAHGSNRVSTIVGHPHRVGCTDGLSFESTFYAPLSIGLSRCPFYPYEHPQVIWVAGGFRHGLRQIIRCDCKWRYETE